jgi:hypothetical protein
MLARQRGIRYATLVPPHLFDFLAVRVTVLANYSMKKRKATSKYFPWKEPISLRRGPLVIPWITLIGIVWFILFLWWS